MPLNFSAPTEQVRNTYAAPARTNPYLTSSQYEGLQLHTPSGLYYQGGNIYEPYTPKPPNIFSMLFGGYSPFGGLGRARFGNTNDEDKGAIKVGGQSFKPFTGNAEGIINGNLSMVSMLNQQPIYQPQGIPNNLLNFLSSPSMQETNNQQGSGAGRFLGLLGSPIITNAQGK